MESILSNPLTWALVVLLVAIVLFARNVRQPALPAGESREQKFEQDVLRLQATVDTLLIRIRELELALSKANARIASLETAGTASEGHSEPLAKPMLLVCGTDPLLYERDRVALRRAGIVFHRIMHATKAEIRAEFARRRQAETLYKWLHISAHAGPQGIELTDGVAEPAFWHTLFAPNIPLGGSEQKVETVFIAGCTVSTVADELAGMVDTVVFFSEDVDNECAARFTYAFWQAIREGKNADSAFNEAVNKTPEVAEFVDIRHR